MEGSNDADVLEYIADDPTREILAEISQEPMSADELSERCDISRATVYRRIDDLRSTGLVEERMELDLDGHHRKTYTTQLESVLMELEGGEYSVTVKTREDAADRITQMWQTMRED